MKDEQPNSDKLSKYETWQKSEKEVIQDSKVEPYFILA